MFDRMPKIVGLRDLSHAHFQGKLFVRPLGIPHTKPHTKFELSSSSSFRDICALTSKHMMAQADRLSCQQPLKQYTFVISNNLSRLIKVFVKFPIH